MAILTIQDLHERAGSVDLSHWNVVETFSLVEAALLSVGADPHEPSYSDMEKLQKNNHPNWRSGASFLRSLKEGVCSGEVICIDIFIKSYYDQWNNWNHEKVDVLNISMGQTDDIIENMTKISRKSLHDWHRRKGLLRAPKPVNKNEVNQRIAIDVVEIIDINDSPVALALALPFYLDPANPMSPQEVRAVNDACAAVYGNSAIKPIGERAKKLLLEFLNRHTEYRALSNAAKSRIALVCNNDRKGGAPKTPG